MVFATLSLQIVRRIKPTSVYWFVQYVIPTLVLPTILRTVFSVIVSTKLLVMLNGVCYTLPTNCQTYQSSGSILVCTNCITGYFPTINAANCIICTGSNLTLISGVCYTVPANCQTYQLSNGSLVCTNCNANYAFYPNTTTGCVDCTASNQLIKYNNCYDVIANCE
jgi:hypothetical protein